MYPYQPFQNMPMLSPSIQYVNGRSSADSYQMQPNSSVILMDSNEDLFYLKKADASGACTIDVYEFQKVEEKAAPEYITREEFDELKNILKERTYEQHYEQPIYRPNPTSEPGTVIVG